jgi:thiol:disulfide interchange protein
VLLSALLGGLLLNPMPCVFPVLSLKALSLAQGGGKGRRVQALHGLSYTLGVLLSFALVAALLLGLRAGGAAIGWGFQLQSPGFVGLLALLLFALGLSLSGLGHFGSGLMGAGERLTQGGGYRASFFTGVLAAAVASPCTAPFMGTALGVAVLLPPALALTVFLALGLGMALPFLLLSLVPRLGRRLPRPGPWMETFKQALAFPLYLTVIWLLWVLGRQAGVDALALALVGLLCLGLALWLFDRPAGVHSAWRRGAAWSLLGLALLSLYLPGRAPPADALEPRPFSERTLAELRAQGVPVFVNMTADWCITCLANERVALNTAAVRQAFERRGVVYLKGDWTRRDPAITQYLARYGRNGVPLYVLYAPGQEGRVWPQLLTPALALEALDSVPQPQTLNPETRSLP